MNTQWEEDVIGEVISAGTHEITGQAWRDKAIPPFGSFVCMGRDASVAGVVCHVENTGLDPYRRPMALERRENEIAQAYPHLPSLLRFQFQALLIGRFEGAAFRFGVPGLPPPLHAEIRICPEAQVREIRRDLGFFRLLVDSGNPSVEELIHHTCLRILEVHGWRTDEAIRLGKALAEHYRDDYDTLRRLLTRMETWLNA